MPGDESANAIRVTLSQNTRERIWVAEVVEGNVTQTAMVEAGSVVEQRADAGSGLTLRLQTVLVSRQPVLAALETSNGLIVLEPEEVVLYARAALAGGNNPRGHRTAPAVVARCTWHAGCGFERNRL